MKQKQNNQKHTQNKKQEKKQQQSFSQLITIKNLNQNIVLLGKIVQVNTNNIKLQFQNSILGTVKLSNTAGYKTNQWLKAQYLHTEQYQNIFSIDPNRFIQDIQPNHLIQVIIQSIEDNGYMCTVPNKQIQFILTNQDSKDQYMKNQIILANVQSIQQNICQLDQVYNNPLEEYNIETLQPGDLIKLNIGHNTQEQVQQVAQQGKYQVYIEEHQKSGQSNMTYRVIGIDKENCNIFVSNKQNFIDLPNNINQHVEQQIDSCQINYQTASNIYFTTKQNILGKISKKQAQHLQIENNQIQSKLRLLYFMPLEQVAVYVQLIESDIKQNIQVGKMLNNVKLTVQSINQNGIHGIFNVNKQQQKFTIIKNQMDQQSSKAQIGQNLTYKQILVTKQNGNIYNLTSLFTTLVQKVQVGQIQQAVTLEDNKVVLSNGLTAIMIDQQTLSNQQQINVLIMQTYPYIKAIQVNQATQENLTQETAQQIIKYKYVPQYDNYLKYNTILQELKQFTTKIVQLSCNCYITEDQMYIPAQFFDDNEQQAIINTLIAQQEYQLEVKQIHNQYKLLAPITYNLTENQAVVVSQNKTLFSALVNTNKVAQIKNRYKCSQFDVIHIHVYDTSKSMQNVVFAQLQDTNLQQFEQNQLQCTNLQLPVTIRLNQQINVGSVVKFRFLLFSSAKNIKFAVLDLGQGQIGILPVQYNIQLEQVNKMTIKIADKILLQDSQLVLLGLQEKDYKNKQVSVYVLEQEINGVYDQNSIECVYINNNLAIFINKCNKLLALHQIDFSQQIPLEQQIQIGSLIDISQYQIKKLLAQQIVPYYFRSGLIQQCLVQQQNTQTALILPEIYHDYNNIYKNAYLSLSQEALQISLLDMEDTKFQGITEINLINGKLSMLQEEKIISCEIGDIIDCVAMGQKEDKIYMLIKEGVKAIMNVKQNRIVNVGTKIKCRIIKKLNNYLIVSDDRIILSSTYTTELKEQQVHIAQIMQFGSNGIKIKIVDTFPYHIALILYTTFQNKVNIDNVQQLYQLNSYIPVVTTKIEDKKIDCICSDAALVEIGANMQQIGQLLRQLNYKQNNKQQKSLEQKEIVQEQEQNVQEEQEEDSIQQDFEQSINEDNFISEENTEQSVQFDLEEKEEKEQSVHFDEQKETQQKEYLSDEQYVELLNQNNQNLMVYINYADKHYQQQNILKAQQILENGIETLKELNDKVQLIVISLIYYNEQDSQLSMTQHMLQQIKTFQAPSLICQQLNSYIIEKQLTDVGVQMWSALWKKRDTKNQIENVKAYLDFIYALNIEKTVNINQLIENINPVEQIELKLYIADKEYQKGRFQTSRQLLMNHKQAYIKMFQMEQTYVQPDNVVSFYKLIIPKCNQKLQTQLLKMLVQFVKQNNLNQEDIKQWIQNLQ